MVLLSAALALDLFFPSLDQSLSFGGGNIHTQDLIVLAALGGWALSRLLDSSSPSVPRTPVLGWPFLIFAIAVAIPTLRGHYAYGTSLIGQPFRLIIYAGIIVTLAGITAPQLLRLLTAVFYSGICVTTLYAVYYVATGTGQSQSFGLSTGGFRPLAISTSIYCSSGLFLALLRLRTASTARGRALHLTIAGLALVCVVLGFGRAVLAAVFVVCMGFLLLSPRLRRSLASIVPLAAPFVALAVIFVALAAPSLASSFVARVSSPPAKDANVRWRVQANETVMKQVREAPLYGVGFGRTSSFYMNVPDSQGFLVPFRQEIGQDPHNGYLYLLAGGGAITLMTFLILLGTYALDVGRRYARTPDDVGRTVLLWSALSLCPVLFNAASGTTFENASNVLNMWALLVVPAVIGGVAAGGSARDVQRESRPRLTLAD